MTRRSSPERSMLVAPWPRARGRDFRLVCDELLGRMGSDYRRMADLAARLPPQHEDCAQWYRRLAFYQTAVQDAVADLVEARLREDGWARVDMVHDEGDPRARRAADCMPLGEAYSEDHAAAIYNDAWNKVDAAAVAGAPDVQDAALRLLDWNELLWGDPPPATWPHTPSRSAPHTDAIGQAFLDARTELHPADALRTLAGIEDAVRAHRGEAIYALRAGGWSWAIIAEAMDTDPETVWERYHHFDEASSET